MATVKVKLKVKYSWRLRIRLLLLALFTRAGVVHPEDGLAASERWTNEPGAIKYRLSDHTGGWVNL